MLFRSDVGRRLGLGRPPAGREGERGQGGDAGGARDHGESLARSRAVGAGLSGPRSAAWLPRGDRGRSGSSAAQHFVTIGAYAYVGGLTRMAQDVPPFMILEGHPSKVRGANVIGMRRGGIAEEEIQNLRDAYRAIWRGEGLRREIFADLEQRFAGSEVLGHLLQSLRKTEQGGKGRYRESMREDFARLGRERILGQA